MGDVECDECHEPATHYCDSGVDDGEFWRFCDAHANPDCCRPLASKSRRSEMRAILQALEKCWMKHQDRTLDDVFAEVKWMDEFDPGDFNAWPDAELLKALEKYAKGGG